MTEDEAKTKWCPHVRHEAESGTFNRGCDDNPINDRGGTQYEGQYGCHCIGSACMAWRWGRKRNPEWKPDHGMLATGWQLHPEEIQHPYIADTEHGFCGLAGKP